jgi:hypothetical protein
MKKERGEMRPLGSTDQGIPSWDKEPSNAMLTPLKNRFSAQHDCSEDEAYRMVKGSTTSSQIKKGGY